MSATAVSASLLSVLILTLSPVELISALPQHNDLILRLGVLPAAEDQQMGPDGGAGVPEPRGGRVPDVLATLPRHGVGGPDHEVVAALFRGLMLLSGTACLGPASEKYDI